MEPQSLCHIGQSFAEIVAERFTERFLHSSFVDSLIVALLFVRRSAFAGIDVRLRFIRRISAVVFLGIIVLFGIFVFLVVFRRVGRFCRFIRIIRIIGIVLVVGVRLHRCYRHRGRTL